MPPFAAQRIHHLVLRVDRLTRGEACYRDALRCEGVHRRDHLGLLHWRAGASMIDLAEAAGTQGGVHARGSPRNLDPVYLRIEPYDEKAVLAHLRQHGIKPLRAARTNVGAEGDRPSRYMRHPGGNAIEWKHHALAASS